MKIIVERKKWSTKEMDNKLFDGTYYDILGFMGKALGISDKDMLNKWNLNEFIPQYPVLEWLTKAVTWNKQDFSNRNLLMHLNDDPRIKNKEIQIKKFLTLAKIDVEFV